MASEYSFEARYLSGVGHMRLKDGIGAPWEKVSWKVNLGGQV